MTTYVAFLRAINLGARRKFPKDAIIAATEGAGFTDVATHINTGNVRLETRVRSRARIEAALEEAYEADRGFAVPTIAFTVVELRDLVAEADRLSEGFEGGHYVSLLKQEPSADAARAVEARSRDAERLVVRGRALHQLVAGGYLDARLDSAAVEKALGVATSRNVTVLRALVPKWCA
ncbi:DUF1697 domain-containing protein [Nocardioides sp. C4-1]|uniref:DUF1697 domain-containing protein n=1 Tax=Nocardioides sp. C4-1 TaxID=3151851 RepID=UPI0032639F97